MKKLRANFYFILAIFSWSTFALAGPNAFTLQGQIIKPNGEKLENSSVSFLVQIYSPVPDKCLLYEERFNGVNMSGSKGIFSLTVGTGVQAGSDFEDSSSLTQILNNDGGAFNPTTCITGGPTYTPSGSDGRDVRLTFNDGTGPVTLASDQKINSVPFAQYSKSLEGLGASDFLNLNAPGTALTQANLGSIFATTQDVTDLRNLIDGSSSDYLVSSPSASVGFNNQRVTDVAAPTAATDAANKNYVDANVGGNTINTGVLGAGETGEVLTWNGTQWVAQNLSAAGYLDNGGNTTGAAITLGSNDNFDLVLETNNTAAITIDNTQGVSLAAGLGVTGGINSGDDFNLLSGSEFRFQDSAGGEYLGFKAPGLLTGSTTLTWPDGDGAANQILTTDGSGTLSWSSPAATSGFIAQGGNSFGGAMVIGTTDNEQIAFRINGTSRVNIATDGRLLVDRLGARNNVAKASIYLFENTVVTYNQDSSPAMEVRQLSATSTQDILQLENNAGPVMVVGQAGSVGIGTETPSTTLDVEGKLTLGPSGTAVGEAGSFLLEELAANGTESVGFRSPDTLSSSILWTLPSDLGSSGQVLKQSATPGILEWASDGAADHGSSSGLADDDHSQYALLGGRSGGQVFTGGIGASETLTLDSTSNGTKGDLLLNPGGGSVGIGTTNAVSLFSVGSSNQFRVGSAGQVGIYNGWTSSGLALYSGTAGYPLVSLDSSGGQGGRIKFANGNGATYDAAIHRPTAGVLRIDNDSGGSAALEVRGSITSGPDGLTSGDTGLIAIGGTHGQWSKYSSAEISGCSSGEFGMDPTYDYRRG